MSTNTHDAIIIGGGHNRLVSGAYFARAAEEQGIARHLWDIGTVAASRGKMGPPRASPEPSSPLRATTGAAARG